MNRTKIILLAGLMSAGMVAPALADYVPLGTVDVGYHNSRTTAFTRFGGKMVGLRVQARGSVIDCDAIVAKFDNGDSQRVFSGRLQSWVPVNLDLAGGRRIVKSLTFVCRSDANGGTINVSADLGPYMNDWRNTVYWNPNWGGPGMGNPPPPPGGPGMGYPPPPTNGNPGGGALSGPGSFDAHDWTTMGSLVFSWRGENTQVVNGWAGRRVDRIALWVRGADAGCSRVTAVFANGQRAQLRAPSTKIFRGQIYQMDLPGGYQNVNGVEMVCRAAGSSDVTINVLARNNL